MMPLKHLINSLSILSPVRAIQKTNSVPSVFFASKTINELAGVAAAPKKPLTPYFRFMKATRAKVQSENPKFGVTDVIKEVAKRWALVDTTTKKKFEDEYKKDREVYDKQQIQYKLTLTPEIVESLKQARQDKLETRERRILKKKTRELEKPKKVPTAFLRFVQDERAKIQPTGNYQVFLKQMGEKWNQLSEAMKKPYIDAYQKEQEAYKVTLDTWEKKMLKEGHLDLVRSKLLIEPPTPKTASPKTTRPGGRSARKPPQ